MKFELIKVKQGLEMYGDIPCLPVEVSPETGERFTGEETDAWLLLDDFVQKIDSICPNELDYGDVDYFDADKCKILLEWLSVRKKENMSSRLRLLYGKLEEYVSRAIRLGTGVVIEL